MMAEVYLKQLREVATAMDEAGAPDLSDDALIYAGSAVWGMWQNHVPGIIRSMWPLLDEQSRLVAYVTAKQTTTYRDPSPPDTGNCCGCDMPRADCVCNVT